MCAHRDRITAALGTRGTWVLAVVERAVTERYLCVQTGERFPDRCPLEAFEMLMDGCVLAVAALDAVAA